MTTPDNRRRLVTVLLIIDLINIKDITLGDIIQTNPDLQRAD